MRAVEERLAQRVASPRALPLRPSWLPAHRLVPL